jgi:hypothetical protein
MLKLVTNLRRSLGGSHHLHLYQTLSTQVASNVLAPPLWHQRFRHPQHLVTTNSKSVLVRARLHQKDPLSSGTLRGLATTSTGSGTPGTGFTAWYLQMLSRYPLPTKSVTAANILAFADMTAQVSLKVDESIFPDHCQFSQLVNISRIWGSSIYLGDL